MSRRGGGAARGSNLETLFSGLPIEDDSQYTVELKRIVLDNDFLNKEREIENYFPFFVQTKPISICGFLFFTYSVP